MVGYRVPIEKEGPYKGCRVRGPYYDRARSREYVDIIFPNGERRGSLYSRYLIEISLNRLLTKEEAVHHIDGDPMNDDISNLEVVSDHSEHMKLHRKNPVEFTCPICNCKFKREGHKLANILSSKKKDPNYKGPFCTPSCTAFYVSNLRRR